MKIIIWIGISLIALIVLLLIVALFVPKTYTISVSQTINKPRQQVYDYLRILGNQTKYSVWVMKDPNLKPEIVGTDGTVGVTQKWNSKDDKVGEGFQTITALSLDRMDVDVTFIRPFEGSCKASNMFKEVSSSQTQLTMEFYSNDKYPFNLMSYFFVKGMLKKDMTKNLENVKKNIEGIN